MNTYTLTGIQHTMNKGIEYVSALKLEEQIINHK